MKTLAVAGCSYSDRHEKDVECFGAFIAERLKFDYLHIARACSSNHRSWYKLTQAILNEQLVAGDVIVLQYTDEHRKILPSVKPYQDLDPDIPNAFGRIEQHDLLSTDIKGYTSDYKANSFMWQLEKENKITHEVLYNNAVNLEFDYDYTITQHKMFEALVASRDIHLVVLFTRYIDPTGIIRFSNPETIENSYDEKQVIKIGNANEPSEHDVGWDSTMTSEYDNSHLSQKGHETLAEGLTKHIQGILHG